VPAASVRRARRTALAVLAWAVAVAVAAPSLPVYLTSSTAIAMEALSEDPLPWTVAVLAAVAVAGGVAAWSWRRPRLASLRGVLLSGALAATVGAGFYGWYVYHLSSATLAPGAGAPTVGEVARDFSVIDPDGDEWGLARFRGRIVMLVFYRGHW
jgi:Peroxiredoxin